jgi:4-hydroxybenzoate polyprenyltransferase
LKQIRYFFEFLVFSNLFIAGCALLMVNQTTHLIIQQSPIRSYLGFVFSSTLCSYSFHYYLTYESLVHSKRIRWAQRYRPVYVVLFILGTAGVCFFGFKMIAFWRWMLPAVVATFLYSAPKIPHALFRVLRKVAIGKTIFLAFIWAYVTTILPVIVAGGLDLLKLEGRTNAFWLFGISQFLLIYAICILFDYRDRQDDRASGVKSLITYLDEKSIRILYYASLAMYAVVIILLGNHGFTVTQMIILLIPAIILSLIFNQATRNFSDAYYYFFLDGLMAFSALLFILYRL